jgi:hypothetical protein
MFLLDAGCTKTLTKVNYLPAKYFEMYQKQTRYRGQQIQGILSQNMTSHSLSYSREIVWVAAVDETDSQSCYDRHGHPFLKSMTEMGWK